VFKVQRALQSDCKNFEVGQTGGWRHVKPCSEMGLKRTQDKSFSTLCVLLRLTERTGLSFEIEAECLKDNPVSWVSARMIKNVSVNQKKK